MALLHARRAVPQDGLVAQGDHRRSPPRARCRARALRLLRRAGRRPGRAAHAQVRAALERVGGSSLWRGRGLRVADPQADRGGLVPQGADVAARVAAGAAAVVHGDALHRRLPQRAQQALARGHVPGGGAILREPRAAARVLTRKQLLNRAHHHRHPLLLHARSARVIRRGGVRHARDGRRHVRLVARAVGEGGRRRSQRLHVGDAGVHALRGGGGFSADPLERGDAAAALPPLESARQAEQLATRGE
mmetsp:Transcript_51267/g.151151  ORF Transcript_51267/g.151151 Transcript_51267/m.151151 type:complete len:248 (+) Transcript_51267:253-996(+)